jgi:hypothetical protein
MDSPLKNGRVKKNYTEARNGRECEMSWVWLLVIAVVLWYLLSRDHSAHHILIHPLFSELSRMTPTRKAAPMFHIAKAATMSIT